MPKCHDNLKRKRRIVSRELNRKREERFRVNKILKRLVKSEISVVSVGTACWSVLNQVMNLSKVDN